MKPFVPGRLPAPINWETLIPEIGAANRALAHYEGSLYGVPNPEVLLSPLTTQEAVLSSKIEGTQATLGEVLQFEAGAEPAEKERRLDIQEILNYRNALRQGEQALKEKPFNLTLLLDLHSILLDSVRGRDKGRGRFRTTQNWIGSPGVPMEQADFVPPDPLHLMTYLDDWEKYYHADRPDALVQLAVVHAQFEIIHPFNDGNGRLGRILVPLFLYEKKLLARPMFYLSSYLESHRDEYIARLRAIGTADGAWEQWIKFFLSGLERQALDNASKARAIIDLYGRMKTRVLELTRSIYAVPLLDQIFERPLFQTNHLKLPGSRQGSFNLIRTLRDAKILSVVREGSGRRGQVLAFRELLNLCEGRDVV